MDAALLAVSHRATRPDWSLQSASLCGTAINTCMGLPTSTESCAIIFRRRISQLSLALGRLSATCSATLPTLPAALCDLVLFANSVPLVVLRFLIDGARLPRSLTRANDSPTPVRIFFLRFFGTNNQPKDSGPPPFCESFLRAPPQVQISGLPA